ncbi:response regulator [Legionella tunisiensis]|uniref:response regulator n=1 Tax=Legionella tunisiensis TaxID=1034944 RepID=UPI0003775B61|nr:response regulator [Legionella tunisiensis]
MEDDFVALRVVERLIREAGCRSISAINGKEALKQATTHALDLIITDIGLPDLSGIELSQQFRTWEKNYQKKPVPIIALTGHAKEEIDETGEQAGINKVVTKPMNIQILNSILHEFNLINAEKVTIKQPISTVLEPKLPEMKAQLFDLKRFPLFDKINGLAAVSGNIESLEKHLKHIISLISNIEPINQAIASDDWHNIKNLALQIKDSATYCGTVRLLYASFYVAYYCKMGFSDLLERLCTQLITVMQETKQYLSTWLIEKMNLLYKIHQWGL